MLVDVMAKSSWLEINALRISYGPQISDHETGDGAVLFVLRQEGPILRWRKKKEVAAYGRARGLSPLWLRSVSAALRFDVLFLEPSYCSAMWTLSWEGIGQRP